MHTGINSNPFNIHLSKWSLIVPFVITFSIFGICYSEFNADRKIFAYGPAAFLDIYGPMCHCPGGSCLHGPAFGCDMPLFAI